MMDFINSVIALMESNAGAVQQGLPLLGIACLLIVVIVSVAVIVAAALRKARRRNEEDQKPYNTKGTYPTFGAEGSASKG